MQMNSKKIGELESNYYKGKYSKAINQITRMLQDQSAWVDAPSVDTILATRIAAILVALMSDRSVSITPNEYKRLCYQQVNVEKLFLLSGFHRSDFLRDLIGEKKENGEFDFSGTSSFMKLFSITPIAHLSRSFVDVIHELPVNIAAPYLFGSIANHCALSMADIDIRRVVLSPKTQLATYEVDENDIEILSNVWERCYDSMIRESLHFRFYINHMLRCWINSSNKYNFILHSSPNKNVIMLLLMSDDDVAVANKFMGNMGEGITAMAIVSDRVKAPSYINRSFSSSGSLKDLPKVLKEIRNVNPFLVLFPTVKVTPLTMILLNMRIAPVQVLGESESSSMSDCMDYILSRNSHLQDDFLETAIGFDPVSLATLFECAAGKGDMNSD